MMKKYRVLHLPTTVGGNPQGLSKALQRLGVDSTSMTLEQNYFQYQADIVLWPLSSNLILKELKRFFFYFRILKDYQVIHYNAGTTLMRPICSFGYNDAFFTKIARLAYSFYTNFFQSIELNVLKLAGKKMFVTYQGDDARQGDYSLKNFRISIAQRVNKKYYNEISDNYKRQQIKKLAAYAEGIYTVNPDLLHVLPEGTRFLPYSHIFFDDWVPNYTQGENRPLRFVHAPSHRAVKGTELIIEAFKQLKEEGYNFEFTLVEGLSNLEAKKLYEKSDVLIDQLFAGWYGGLAVEAMALGKPVVVYLREEDFSLIEEDLKKDLPFIQATPDTVKQALKSVLDMPRENLLSTAKKSREFVEKWHDPLRIALEYKKEYERVLDSHLGGEGGI